MGKAEPLSKLLRLGTAPVARGSSGLLSTEALLARAATIATQLPVATPGSEVAFSFDFDMVSCAAALFATWSKGHTAVLPEDGTVVSLKPLLERKRNVAFLHDTGVGLGICVPTLLASSEHTSVLDWQVSQDDLVVLRAFRGTTFGEPLEATWTADELVTELDRIVLGSEAVVDWSSLLCVASCFTPTAVAGLFLGLLAPIRRGVPFQEKRMTPLEFCNSSDAILQALVASPAHSRSLGQVLCASQHTGAAPRVLLCSGGELDTKSRGLLSTQGVDLVRVPELALALQADSIVDNVRNVLLCDPDVADVAVASVGDGASLVVLVLACAASLAEASLRARIGENIPAHGAFRLRILQAIPRDLNGSFPDWRTYLYFKFGRNGAPLDFELGWQECREAAPDTRRFRTSLPENFAYFAGHYTDYPVLAGAAQIKVLVQACIQLVDPGATHVSQLRGAKFLARIAPGDQLEVTVVTRPRPGEFSFEVWRDKTRCSAGTILYSLEGEGV